MQKPQRQTLSFGDFTLDLSRGRLLRDNEEVKLRPKSFEVLRHLVENSGRLVGKDELIGAVWHGTAVTDDSLVQCLIEVRRALGDGGQRLVRTVPRRGYVFEAEVKGHEPAGREVIYTEEVEGVRLTVEGEDQEEQAVSRGGVVADARAAGARPLRSVIGRHRLAALLILAALGAAIFTVAYFATPRRAPGGGTAPAPPGAIRSVAVLPLENLSGDPAQEYFADGMTEELIGKLARIGSLRVISRTSVMRYKAGGKSLPEIARELNVDAVIEGTVQRSGGRVRVTAKLIHAATDSPVWARDYERELSDVLRLQSDVAREVADEIRIHLTAEERARLASARSVKPEAHEAYLLGRHHFNQGNEQGWKQAIEYFERATQIAPDYAAAYAGLSDAWLSRGIFGANFKEVEAPARAAALKAIGLDEQLAEVYLSLANIKQFYDWDWAGSEREFRRALELDPGGLNAHVYYGHLLMHLGRHDEAIREGQIAVQLDPLSSGTRSALGRFLYRARRYEEALPHLRRAVELEPRSVAANFRLGDLYAQLGRYDEAIAAYEKIRELMPQGGDFQGGIARVHALAGRRREARRMVRGLKANAYIIAAVHAALDDKDEAFGILEKAVEERQVLAALKEDPPFENLHSDPRWKALLRRLNFPPE